MADIALGVVGAVGVALQSATAAHDFLSSIRGAPRSVKSLATHINTLRSVLAEVQLRVTALSTIHRPEEGNNLVALTDALQDCQAATDSLDSEVRYYVRWPKNSKTPHWGGKGLLRRIRYGFKKGRIIELQQNLFASIQLLHLALSALEIASRHHFITSSDSEELKVQKSLDDLRLLAHGQSGGEDEAHSLFVDAEYWSEGNSQLDQDPTESTPAPQDDPFVTDVVIDGVPGTVAAVVDSGLEMNYIPLSVLQYLQPQEATDSLIESKSHYSLSNSTQVLGKITLTLTSRSGARSKFNTSFWVLDSSRTVNSAAQHIRLGRDWIRRSVPGYAHLAQYIRRATTASSMLSFFHGFREHVGFPTTEAQWRVLRGRRMPTSIFVSIAVAGSLLTFKSLYHRVGTGSPKSQNDSTQDNHPTLTAEAIEAALIVFLFGIGPTRLIPQDVMGETSRFYSAMLVNLPWLLQKLLITLIDWEDRRTSLLVAPGAVQFIVATLWATATWYLSGRAVNGSSPRLRHWEDTIHLLWVYYILIQAVCATSFFMILIMDRALTKLSSIGSIWVAD